MNPWGKKKRTRKQLAFLGSARRPPAPDASDRASEATPAAPNSEAVIRETIDLLEQDLSAMIHDVGKLGVPTDILTSPEALSPAEERIMRDHPVIGEQILRQIPGMDEIATAVRHEHERWDGGGYPDGLSGDAIPLASRIVFACDAFHAMTSDRPYRRALDRQVITDEFTRFSGSQFDPNLAKELLLLLETGVWDVDPQLLADSVGEILPRSMAAAG